MTRKQKKGKFKVGDWVSYPRGSGRSKALVIEDRGPLGTGGRWIYSLRVYEPPVEPYTFELSEDFLEPAEPKKVGLANYVCNDCGEKVKMIGHFFPNKLNSNCCEHCGGQLVKLTIQEVEDD